MSSAYLFACFRRPGLVEGLYRFTLYALRLDPAAGPFTSDYLARRMVFICSGNIFTQRDPPAIVRFIAAIAVDTVNRQIVPVAMGKSPRSERGEIAPFVTNTDALPPVQGISLAVFVAAPLPHSAPDRVKARPVIVALSVYCICFPPSPGFFPAQAPTRFRVSVFQISGCRNYGHPTGTGAFPTRLVVFNSAKLNNCQSSKFLSGQINHTIHPPLGVFSRLGFQLFSGILHRQTFTDEEVLVGFHAVIQVDALIEPDPGLIFS